jgi:hypothetical protein
MSLHAFSNCEPSSRQQLQGVAVSGREPDVGHDEGVCTVGGHDIYGDSSRCRTLKDSAPNLESAAMVMLKLGGVGAEQVHLHDGEGGGDAQPLLGDLPHLHLDEPGLGPLAEWARLANLLRQSSPPHHLVCLQRKPVCSKRAAVYC